MEMEKSEWYAPHTLLIRILGFTLRRLRFLLIRILAAGKSADLSASGAAA